MKKCFRVILAFVFISMVLTGCSSRQKGEPITANVYRFTPYADWEMETEHPDNGADYFGIVFLIKPSEAGLCVAYTDRTVHTNVPEAKKRAELAGQSVGTISYEDIVKDECVIGGRQMYRVVMKCINSDPGLDLDLNPNPAEMWIHVYYFDTDHGLGEVSISYNADVDYDPQEDLNQVLNSLEFLEE
ncbi:hypothetical protein [Candidatus Soleaferrea massiliensis]|uniref:hypothetical protein n=1 Tax=Candidatus Soleaferrea massiliensis TaxID=1470354 RepID=UPI00058CB50F|nr:hypothetical protein [Candidatus Soleaferrea massiliensis]